MRLTDAWQFWLAMITLGLATLGAVTGVVSLVKQARTAERSAKAAESSASTSDDALRVSKQALDDAKQATQAAERSAQAADRAVVAADKSATEAGEITRIEKRRYHNEIGPSGVDVEFRWRPGTPDSIIAIISNTGALNYDVLITHYYRTGGHAEIGRRHLAARSTVTVGVGPLPIHGLTSQPDQWETVRTVLAGDTVIENQLRSAVEASNFLDGRVEIGYSSTEACDCDKQPPSTDYGHWETSHRLLRVSF